MFNLDPAKLLVIGVVAIILLGPDKLPQVARQVGGAWRTFNEFRQRMETGVRDSIPDLPSSSDIARLARSPSALLNHLSNMAPEEEAGTASTGTVTASTESPPAPGRDPLPDGAPIVPFPPAPVAVTPAGAGSPIPSEPPTAPAAEVTVFGDPSLN
jgi:sec-independent protein translocase protein TatB